jgi:hypothetical protein
MAEEKLQHKIKVLEYASCTDSMAGLLAAGVHRGAGLRQKFVLFLPDIPETDKGMLCSPSTNR